MGKHAEDAFPLHHNNNSDLPRKQPLCCVASSVPHTKYIQEADYVDVSAGFGEFSAIFTKEDRRDLIIWRSQVMDNGVGSSEQPEENKDLALYSVMCELNRQSQKTRTQSYRTGQVNTLYKKVADKVRPVDDPGPPEKNNFGREDWKELAIERQLLRLSLRPADIGPYDHILERRYAPFPRGLRLTPERLKEQNVGEQLFPREREILHQMLFNREGAIAFTFTESGRISHEVAPPYKIKTVPHKAWQVKSFPIAKSAEEEVMQMFHERLQRGVLERCDSPYRNPWFLVAKKDGTHRLVDNAQHLNRVTRRDANMAPTADEFSERFAGCLIISLMDYFSGYDQYTLHEDSRDMTAIHTPVGLLRHCTLVQGATNSVAAFQRANTKILRDHWRHTLPFMDDITSGGPRTDYGGEEALPGVRRYVLEHIVQLDKVLADIERAGATVSGKKCYWGMDRLVVVGYEVSPEGRYPNQKKVEKIANWPECRTTKEVRMFLGICVYYRIWVFCFAIVAKPLFKLLKTDQEWEWGESQNTAMETLKASITKAPALMTPDYKTGGRLYMSVDASQEGAGAVLEQIGPDGKRHPCRFESTMWSEAESKWHSTKLECRAVLWGLKKFRIWLYGRQFTIETDAQTLIAQLNRSSADVPGSVMNRWLAAILMWDFDIRHVPGKKNVVADALSRYPKPEGWTPPQEAEDSVEDFIENLITNLESAPPARGRVLKSEYSEESEEIARFLTTMTTPKGMSRGELRAWKKRALNFFTREGYLFRKTSRNIAIRRVIDDDDLRTAAIWDIHRQIGHRGINAVFSMLAQRYWWPKLYDDVKLRLSRCEQCQYRSTKKMVDMLTNSYSHALWEAVAVDVVYMPQSKGKKFLVIAREYLSGWVEARALADNRSSTIAKFIYEDIICRWSMTRRLLVDGGPDFRKVVKFLASAYKIRRVQMSAFNSQAMGKIEGGHKPIVNALAKLTGQWVDNLHTVLLADRISIQSQTGYSPFQLVTGQNPVLPIELALPTWQTLPFRQVNSRDKLLAIRAMQLDLRDQFVKEAISRTDRMRAARKEYWDDNKEVRRHPIAAGDLVLVWDSVRELDMSRDRKLSSKWLGPYRVSMAGEERGTYKLEDLDGARFRRTTPGWRLKLFRQREAEDVRSEDRGIVKLWDPSRWENAHVDTPTPAQDDEIGNEPQVEEDEHTDQRTLRDLQHRRDRAFGQPSQEGPHRQTQLTIQPRQLSGQEKDQYEIITQSSSDSSDDDE